MFCPLEFFVIVHSQHHLKQNSPLVLHECLLVVRLMHHAHIFLHTIHVHCTHGEAHLSISPGYEIVQDAFVNPHTGIIMWVFGIQRNITMYL